MGKLTYLVFTNGERYPVLIDDDGIPDYWTTLFVTVTLRPRLTASAIENTLRNILHLRLWEEFTQRDLASELSRGDFLSDEDIFSLRDHCMQDARSIRKWMSIKKNEHVTSMSRSHPVAPRTIDRISKEHFSNRISHISHFLHFTARTMLRRRENQVALKQLIEDTKRRLLAVKQKVVKKSSGGYGQEYRVPPPASFEKLIASVKPDSPDNPYEDQNIRIRNSLMFDLMYESGVRSGELLALRIGDIDYHEGAVSVVRRHDDPDDPRTKQPVAKTLPRTIPISLPLARGLYDYVMKIRNHIPGANRHPFLFVTHKSGEFSGRPISDTTFRNRIMKAATKIFPDIFDEIKRHGFRHNFNYRISNRVDAINRAAELDPKIAPINEKQEMQIRKELNGWSSDKSAEIYNKRHIKEIAEKLMRQDMEDQAKHINKTEK